MKLFDPHRKRVNDTPELLGRRVAVPRLSLFPRPDGCTTRISTMIPDNRGRFASRQVLRDVPDEELPKIINRYRIDPEGTLELLFDITLAPIEEPTDSDLARDLRRERNAPPTAAVAPVYEDIEV